ncbi:MAG: transporter substrate-binding protein [Herminiimonas sp.]|nr:transporter substrate-binding protein [Herminiimonas sp.]
MYIIRLKFLLSILLIASAVPAWAADNPSIASLVSYQGADRQQRLIAGAKKEGSLSVYTSISSAAAQKLKADFEQKYGIKIKLWRAGDRAVLQKIVSESKTSLAGVDVVNIGSLEMEMLHREKVLQPVKSPYASKLIAGAVAPHNEWVSTFVNVVVLGYNTDKVKKADLPKTYQDLLDPKWKGRLGIEATDQEWFYAIVKNMGEEKGLKYFRDLVATNGLSVRNGHSLLGNLIVAGEVPLGLTVYNHTIISAKRKGAPVDYAVLDPAIAVSFSMGISNRPANPYAALLFYEYMLTDGQKVFAEIDYVPTNKEVDTPFRNTNYQMVDKARFLDEFNKWNDLWEDVIVQRK